MQIEEPYSPPIVMLACIAGAIVGVLIYIMV